MHLVCRLQIQLLRIINEPVSFVCQILLELTKAIATKNVN